MTIFDTRLSNILIFWSPPPEANKFPLLWQTSIHCVESSRCVSNWRRRKIHQANKVTLIKSPKFSPTEKRPHYSLFNFLGIESYVKWSSRRRRKKNQMHLHFDSRSTGFSKMKASIPTSSILRKLWSDLTNSNGSSGFVLHMQRPPSNLRRNDKQKKLEVTMINYNKSEVQIFLVIAKEK
mgnify:CR=1 FL=1